MTVVWLKCADTAGYGKHGTTHPALWTTSCKRWECGNEDDDDDEEEADVIPKCFHSGQLLFKSIVFPDTVTSRQRQERLLTTELITTDEEEKDAELERPLCLNRTYHLDIEL